MKEGLLLAVIIFFPNFYLNCFCDQESCFWQKGKLSSRFESHYLPSSLEHTLLDQVVQPTVMQ